MKPILFSASMVQAILDGSKTMTRRVAKVPEYAERRQGGLVWYDSMQNQETKKCSKYQPGDVLWVRETWNQVMKTRDELAYYKYKADEFMWENHVWRPSIHMPRKAARIFLHITDVRVERVQDITAEDCLREGVEREAMEVGAEFTTGIFHGIWDDLYAKDGYGWNANPWVFVYGFERIEKPK